MKYIFNNKGECVASSDSEVSQEWIDSIGGIAVESDKNYIISDIMLLDGVITVLTPQEVTPSKEDVVVTKVDTTALLNLLLEQQEALLEVQSQLEELKQGV